jgi:anti-sigma-K factor RskA
MSEQLNNMNDKNTRYHQINIVEHLASQYVLGTLSKQVQRRMITLRKTHELLDQRIHFWEEKLVHLDQQTAELPVRESTWDNIAQAIGEDNLSVKNAKSENSFNEHSIEDVNTANNKSKNGFLATVWAWFATPQKLTVAFSMVGVLFISLFLMNPNLQKSDELSYVAVLTNTNGNAHIVASTYGESKKLIINVIESPALNNQQSHELWVVSKTDHEARSLGVIPQGQTLIEQQLTQAQWRLIKDSKSLIVTIEDEGGSPIGEPGDVIVSRGLCVRLQEWDNNA